MEKNHPKPSLCLQTTPDLDVVQAAASQCTRDLGLAGGLSFGILGAEQQDGSGEVALTRLRMGFVPGAMEEAEVEEGSSAELGFQARGWFW